MGCCEAANACADYGIIEAEGGAATTVKGQRHPEQNSAGTVLVRF